MEQNRNSNKIPNPNIIARVSDLDYVKNFINIIHSYDNSTKKILKGVSLGEYLKETTLNINLYDINVDTLSDKILNRLTTILNYKWLNNNIWRGLKVDDANYIKEAKRRYLRIYKIPSNKSEPSISESLKISSYGRSQPYGNLNSGYPGGQAIKGETDETFESFLKTINRELLEELGFTINVDFKDNININEETKDIGGNKLTAGTILGNNMTLSVTFRPFSSCKLRRESILSIYNTRVTISYHSYKYYLNIGLNDIVYEDLKNFITENFTPIGRNETMDVMMKKYIKYKAKYSNLKKMIENKK